MVERFFPTLRGLLQITTFGIVPLPVPLILLGAALIALALSGYWRFKALWSLVLVLPWIAIALWITTFNKPEWLVTQPTPPWIWMAPLLFACIEWAIAAIVVWKLKGGRSFAGLISASNIWIAGWGALWACAAVTGSHIG